MRYATLAVLLALVACEGPTGPEGPAGTVERATIILPLDQNGGASTPLGSAANAPLLACYTSDKPNVADNATWLLVGDSSNGAFPRCNIVRSGGVWSAVMTGGTPGWYAMFVVIY
jgi:hypothetical protein